MGDETDPDPRDAESGGDEPRDADGGDEERPDRSRAPGHDAAGDGADRLLADGGDPDADDTDSVDSDGAADDGDSVDSDGAADDGDSVDADDADDGDSVDSDGADVDESTDAEDADEADDAADESGGGLSPAGPEAHSQPGQAPSESVEAPAGEGGDAPADGDAADAGDAPAGGDEMPTVSDADGDTPDDAAETADGDDPAYGEESPDAEDAPDPLADPETQPGEADGGVITDEDDVSPVGDDRDGHLVDEALVDEGPTEPPDDEEMPLADHIEEMVRRLAVVVLIAGGVSLALFPLAEIPIEFLWDSILPTGPSTDPRVYGPLELMFTRLKVASLGGLVVALPVFVYETYQFMRPGLYPHERRYYLAAVPTSLVLALVGIGFAYFFVLPAIFIYFLEYTQDAALVAFSLKKTFDLILILMGYLAIVFQIPLFIMLAIMMGLTTRQWLADRRIYFWGGFLGVSFFFGIDPTGMAPIIVAATMVVLFEGTLLLLKWTGRG